MLQYWIQCTLKCSEHGNPHCRLLEEESAKRAELEKWHLQQQQTIQMTEAEKQELENQRMIKEQALQVAMQQLRQLELERKEALEQYEVSCAGHQPLILTHILRSSAECEVHRYPCS